MNRLMLFALVLLVAAVLPAGAGPAPSQPPPGPTIHRPRVPLPPPLPVRLALLLDAIHQQESGGGANCRAGAHGEIGCYQILPDTALRHGCHDYGRDCAERIVVAGQAKCGMAVTWIAHYYNTGSCGPRPGHYAQDVQRRWMTAMIAAQRAYSSITLARR